ncbi:MAG: hypothetical protein Roseis2KO_28990 [Roseivirga sp.]
MSRTLSFIQNLSLDVTAGAVISSLFICQYFEVPASFEMMLGLGIAIWLIYTIDHLRDATRSGNSTVNPRHAFHLKYQKVIVVCACLVFGVGLVNAFQLPLSTIKSGLVLGGLSVLYFVYLKFSKRQRLKELLAALIYTAGIFAGPVSLIAHWEWSYLVFFLLFFLLVAANLVLFPLYEMEMDSKDQLTSIALKAGKRKTERLVWSLLGLHFILVVISIMSFPQFHSRGYVFVAMNLVLVTLLTGQERYGKHQLYRWMGDGIFFIPLLIWV